MDPITRARLNSHLLQALAELLSRRVRDPRVEGVSLTGVEVSGDLSFAKVYYSLLGDDEDRRIAQKGLENVAQFLRREVGRNIRLRTTPVLRFHFDASLERGRRIEEALRDLGPESNPKAEGEDSN